MQPGPGPPPATPPWLPAPPTPSPGVGQPQPPRRPLLCGSTPCVCPPLEAGGVPRLQDHLWVSVATCRRRVCACVRTRVYTFDAEHSPPSPTAASGVEFWAHQQNERQLAALTGCAATPGRRADPGPGGPSATAGGGQPAQTMSTRSARGETPVRTELTQVCLLPREAACPPRPWGCLPGPQGHRRQPGGGSGSPHSPPGSRRQPSPDPRKVRPFDKQ